MDDELCYVKKSPLFYGIGGAVYAFKMLRRRTGDV